MKRAILHVDMDAFYASVEQRDAPALRGRQVIVGGHAQRGVVLAASYEVRGLGVRSAMPMHRAVRLAPQAIVVPPRFSAYVEASERIHAVFERFTPLIEPLSLDEAFLDVTASQALFGTPVEIAERIRREIREATDLPCSAGVAPVKFAAKVASDLAKPNGLRVVPEDGVVDFLAPLPVGRLWGVGPKLEERLHALRLFKIGDLAARGEVWLTRQLGEAGASLHALSRGVDPRAVVPDRDAKSIGAEDTFEVDLADVEALRAHVHSQALRVGRRLRHSGLKARVVVLKLKLADFTLLTRRRTLESATDDGQTLYRTAAALLDEHHQGRAFRLTGVSASDFGGEGPPQLDLFAAPPPKHEQLNAALDRIAARFGTAAITTADLAPDEEAPARGRRLRQTGWQGGKGEE